VRKIKIKIKITKMLSLPPFHLRDQTPTTPIAWVVAPYPVPLKLAHRLLVNRKNRIMLIQMTNKQRITQTVSSVSIYILY